MSSAGGEDSSSTPKGKEKEEDGARRDEGVETAEGEVDLGDLYGAAAGWVEARTSCPHLGTMPPAADVDLARVPPPDSPCSRCHHPAENWLCLICKDVLCSRFINKHMLCHYQETGHCLALSFSLTCGQVTPVIIEPLASLAQLPSQCFLKAMPDAAFCGAMVKRDLSVWCFACDSYLDVQAILELRPVYEVAHLLKFGERPPFRSLEVLDLSTGEDRSSSSGA